MKEEQYNDLLEEQEEKTDYRALLFRYLIHWPWFVASLLVFLAGGWLYLQRTAPVYRISSTVLIQDNKQGGSGSLSALQELGIATYGNSTTSATNWKFCAAKTSSTTPYAASEPTSATVPPVPSAIQTCTAPLPLR